MRCLTKITGLALMNVTLIATPVRAEVGSGRTREPDVSDPRAVGHRGVLDRPSNVGTNDRSNWRAVEAARDRGADRIVDDPTWELDRLNEDREARRETDVVLEDRDRTLRLDARNAKEQKRDQPKDASGSVLRPDRNESMSGFDSQIIDDEGAMDQARKEISRALSDLRSSESREVSEAEKKFSSPTETEKLKAETNRIRTKYSGLRDKAMDDYVSQTDRIMGLPKMIEDPIPPEKPTTRPAKKAPPKTRPAEPTPATVPSK